MTGNDAIAVSIRFHFCNVDGNELEIYDQLVNGTGTLIDNPVYCLFEQLSMDELFESVSDLATDILLTSRKV